MLPERGLLVPPSFRNSRWRSRSRWAVDGVLVSAESVKLLSSQGGSGNNIGLPPNRQQAHCLGLGGDGGSSPVGEATNLG